MRFHALRSLMALAFLSAIAMRTPCLAQVGPSARRGIFFELSAGPLLGIDDPIKGCSGGLALGLALPPFRGGLRAGAAYDLPLGAGFLRLDAELGLGSGLRAIIGFFLPMGVPSLPDPSSETAERLALEASGWPNRFGLSATIAEFPGPVLGMRLRIDAELAYNAYRFADYAATGEIGSGPTALSGAAAFAAAVEARIALCLAGG